MSQTEALSVAKAGKYSRIAMHRGKLGGAKRKILFNR